MTAEMLLLIPTRGRPRNAARLDAALRATTSDRTEWLFIVDDDPTNTGAYRNAAAPIRFQTTRRGLVGTLNHWSAGAAKKYRAVAFMGDDHLPRTQGWDALLLGAIGDGPGLAYGDDLLQRAALPTMVAMSSDIIRALGYMVPPALWHLYCDNFWLELGAATDTLHYVPEAVIEHVHPVARKATWDAGYTEVNSPGQYSADERAWRRYLRTRFDADVRAVLDLKRK